MIYSDTRDSQTIEAASTNAVTLAYSVIIEWENVLLAESSRAVEMLRRLSNQIRSLREKGVEGEIIVARDADNRSTEPLDRVFQAALGAASVPVREVEARDKRYYEKKNEGAAAANGAVIVFLDSDVIPEDQWLERLLSSFSRRDVAVVAGSTYVEPVTRYAKAVAAFWFFPPRSSEEGLIPADMIFGNNVAFRREVFLAHPFPVVNQYRGQMGLLADELREKGFGIFLQRSARCAHPPPNGLVHFFRRAVCEGHDNIVIGSRSSGRSRLPWRYTYWSIHSWLRASFRAIRERKRVLNLSNMDVLAASSIALCYIAFMVLGEIMTRIDSSSVPRRFSI